MARVGLEMVGGWEVLTAPSGREGLALAKPFDPLTLGSRIAEMLGWPAGAAA